MLLLGPAARLAGYTSREGLVRAVRPDRGEELSRRAGGHPVPAPLAKRLSGFWRCGFAVLLVSVRLHLNDSDNRPAICRASAC